MISTVIRERCSGKFCGRRKNLDVLSGARITVLDKAVTDQMRSKIEGLKSR